MDQKLDVKKYVRELGAAARAAARELARAGTLAKNRALAAVATEIRDASASILAANADDLRQAKRNKADAAFLDRLALTAELVEQMAAGVEAVAALADPVGQISERARHPRGIEGARVRVPLGVVGIIYDARPDVTGAAAALCPKSGK